MSHLFWNNMLTHWNKLLNTDCIVVDVGPDTIYPIFRVGQSTLMSVCDKKYTNSDIKNCEHIDILIREPRERFVSGVNEYCVQHNLDVNDTWNSIADGEIIDRHFAPQFIWLMNLYRFYRGVVTIRPFSYIKQITDVHLHKSDSKVEVPILDSYVDVDQCLTRYYDQTVNIDYLIKRYRNVLS